MLFSSHGLFLSRIIELFFHTEHHGRSRGFVTNYRIVDFFFTRRIAEVTVFSHEFSFCPELSNLRIGLFSHGESRRVTVLLSRDLSFGPTDQREVICELVYSRGMSRMVTAFLSRDMFFGSTDQWEVICELVSSHGLSRMVVEVMRVEL